MIKKFTLLKVAYNTNARDELREPCLITFRSYMVEGEVKFCGAGTLFYRPSFIEPWLSK